MASQYTNKHKNKKWWAHQKFWIGFVSILAIFLGLIFSNYYFKVRNISIEFLDADISDEQKNAENLEIKKYLENEIRKEGNNLLDYIFLDKDLITKLVRDEYQIVDIVQFAKKMNLDLNVKVSKNDEFFYACVDEDSGFLVRCMLGNSSGAFFKEVNEDYTNPKVLKFEINPKVLYSKLTEEKGTDLDSLSGNRIYTENDFLVLREILKWLEKNGFIVKEVYVNELKIVEVKTDFYILKISLDKGYVDTVKDFETISRTGKLQEAINEDRDSIEYIDLSYKDKVFFKLKNDFENATETDIMSTSTHE